MSEGITLPTGREDPFDPPAGLREIAGWGPVHRMTYADGKLGWLVTGYDEARAVLDDRRFSNRLELGASPPIEELGGGDQPRAARRSTWCRPSRCRSLRW
jgi:cytochrome P450